MEWAGNIRHDHTDRLASLGPEAAREGGRSKVELFCGAKHLRSSLFAHVAATVDGARCGCDRNLGGECYVEKSCRAPCLRSPRTLAFRALLLLLHCSSVPPTWLSSPRPRLFKQADTFRAY